MSGQWVQICTWEVKALTAMLECVKEPSIIDSASGEPPVGPRAHPRDVRLKGV
jgi:hypothetical protein